MSKAPSPATCSRSGSTRSCRAPTPPTSTCPACSASSRSSTRTARSSISISTSTAWSPSSCPASSFRCGRSPARSASRARSRAATARVPPGEYAGNMDIRDLVAGTTLYVPVHVPGALLWTGDSHAAPGQRRGQPHRDRDRLQGVQHHGRRGQGPAARHAAHRNAALVDHHGLRPGSQQGVGRRPRRRPSSSWPSSARSRPRRRRS